MRPARLSGPDWAMTSLPTDSAPPPEKGRSSASGRHSGGTPSGATTGASELDMRSMAPDARTIAMTVSMMSTGGKISRTTKSPCLAPSISAL